MKTARFLATAARLAHRHQHIHKATPIGSRWISASLKSTSGDPVSATYAWGSCDRGQLGLSVLEDLQPVPVSVPSLRDVVSLTTGPNHSIARDLDGCLSAFGVGENGQLGNTSSKNVATPTRIDLPPADYDVTACGGYHSIVASSRSAGIVYSFGCGAHGQLGLGKTITTDVLQPVRIDALSAHTIIDASCGEDFSLFVTSEGELYGCGRTDFGQLRDPATGGGTVPDPTSIAMPRGLLAKEVSSGWGHSLVLCEGGAVVAFGSSLHGQCTGVIGSLITPIEVDLPSPAIAIACGAAHSLVLAADGTLFSWGSHRDGHLGTGSDVSSDTAVPQRVHVPDDVGDVVSISAGTNHSAAVTNRGVVLTWGYGLHDALGLGRAEHAFVPRRVPIEVDFDRSTEARIGCGMDVTFLVVREE
eukprot:TRINITY_DN6780_c0_g1_i1.p1 TRINITY_DN6780_c0_g1~~TRINITY_DN6780_c0_g1_i1.p1  ORF type:complete len:416 (+),score=44.78 TRINITY_DN6780_c0_g1_i1:182-1429(+)